MDYIALLDFKEVMLALLSWPFAPPWGCLALGSGMWAERLATQKPQKTDFARLETTLLEKHPSSRLWMLPILSHERKDGAKEKGTVCVLQHTQRRSKFLKGYRGVFRTHG